MKIEKEKFAGGVAVITGAGAGIGLGLARRAAALGMKVVLAEINEERLAAANAELRAQGAETLAVVTDVSQPNALDALADTVYDQWGDVRLLINNAGIETIGLSWEISTEGWERTLNVNIHGIVHGVRAFMPRILASGKETWVANLASIGAFGQMPYQTAYIMSKHAIQAFTECLSLEIGLTGKPVHISSILPGMVRTSIFQQEAPQDSSDVIATRHRETMRHYMASGGMDLAEASASIIRQIAEGAFFVSTQPEMTDEMIAGRVDFLQGRKHPQLTEQTQALLDVKS